MSAYQTPFGSNIPGQSAASNPYAYGYMTPRIPNSGYRLGCRLRDNTQTLRGDGRCSEFVSPDCRGRLNSDRYVGWRPAQIRQRDLMLNRCGFLEENFIASTNAYVEPKPVGVEHGHGCKCESCVRYRVPEYPPTIYWYPNPMECEDVCGRQVCNRYYRQLNDYRMCQVCQSQKTPMCWNPNAQRCEMCSPEHAWESCSDRFGAQNPNGWLHANTGPINPKYTGCQNVTTQK
jgi:hypothetical protein